MIDAIAERGRDPYPRKVRFTTWTLAYNQMKWVTVDALGKHWERARLDAEIADDHTVRASTANVTAFTLEMGPGGCPLDNTRKPVVVIDGHEVTAPVPMSDRSWTAHFRKTGAHWAAVESAVEPGLHKRHGLQGPVDDAFLYSFIFVRPTGTSGRARDREVGGGGAGARDQGMAAAVPRRGAGAGRHGDHRRRYRVEQPGAVGRSRQQQGAGADRRQAARALGRRIRWWRASASSPRPRTRRS